MNLYALRSKIQEKIEKDPSPYNQQYREALHWVNGNLIEFQLELESRLAQLKREQINELDGGEGIVQGLLIQELERVLGKNEHMNDKLGLVLGQQEGEKK